jgi:DNA polymerase-3 subunit beta
MTKLNINGDRKLFLAMVQSAESVTPSHSTKPILAQLLLKAEKGKVSLTATDLSVGIRCETEKLNIVSDGEAIITAQRLLDIFKVSESQNFTLTQGEKDNESSLPRNENQVKITLSDGEYTIPIVINEYFPEINQCSVKDEIDLSPAKLAEMIKHTVFAVDKESHNPVLSGVVFIFEKMKLFMCGSNGRVLGEANYEHNQEFEHEKIVMPSIALAQLLNLLNNPVDELRIAITTEKSNNSIFIKMKILDSWHIHFTSRLIEGTFPAYKGVLMQKPEYTVKYKKDDLIKAIKKANVMRNDTNMALRINFKGENTCEIRNIDNCGGDCKIDIPCELSPNAMVTIFGIDADYLSKILANVKSNEVILEVCKALIIRDVSTFLVMPIKFD